MGLADKIKSEFTPELRYVILFFIVTRVILIPLGLVARRIGEAVPDVSPRFVEYAPQWLGIWGMWDSRYYLDIAANWTHSVYFLGWFPLYPLLARAVGLFTGDVLIAALIVSNLSLIVAGVLLFRLVRLYYDTDTAYRSVKYLFLFPTGFLLSAILSESLALVLVLLCFYFAAKDRWSMVGVFGFLLSLTRPEMVFMLLPMSFLYLAKRDFKVGKVGLDALPLALFPLGLLTFMAGIYSLTGDFLGYFHYKHDIMGQGVTNPLSIVLDNILKGDSFYMFNGFFALAAVALVVSHYRRIEHAQWIFAAIVLAAPLVYSTDETILAISRHVLTVFPLYIILALLTSRKGVDDALTIFLVFLQAALMATWTSGSGMVV